MPVVVLNAMSKAHGWDTSLDWSEAALRERVGHAQLRVRAVPQQGGVVRFAPESFLTEVLVIQFIASTGSSTIPDARPMSHCPQRNMRSDMDRRFVCCAVWRCGAAVNEQPADLRVCGDEPGRLSGHPAAGAAAVLRCALGAAGASAAEPFLISICVDRLACSPLLGSRHLLQA